MCTIDVQNLIINSFVYLRLHKNDKWVDLSIVQSAHFKTIKFLRFIILV
jgi:hypothetical protein